MHIVTQLLGGTKGSDKDCFAEHTMNRDLYIRRLNNLNALSGPGSTVVFVGERPSLALDGESDQQNRVRGGTLLEPVGELSRYGWFRGRGLLFFGFCQCKFNCYRFLVRCGFLVCCRLLVHYWFLVRYGGVCGWGLCLRLLRASCHPLFVFLDRPLEDQFHGCRTVGFFARGRASNDLEERRIFD